MQWKAVITAASTSAVIAVFGWVSYVYLTNPDFASVEFDTFDWQENGAGFTAEETVSRNQNVCICGGYECMAVDPTRFEGTNIEPTHLAYDGWLRRDYIIVRDPSVTDNDPNWGRPVDGEASCVSKKKGEKVKYMLTEFFAPNSSGTASKAHLLLTIK